MNPNAQTAMARWQKIESLVQDWLHERQQLLYLLCALRGLRGTGGKPMVAERVKEFCELLMDYISAGYFEVYQELAQEARNFERDHPAVAWNILRRLEESTDEALAFNDDFDTEEQISDLIHVLPQRLTRLMEKLEERFALEDQLIVSVHQTGQPVPLRVH